MATPAAGWRPANEIERELANALEAGDARGYARTVLTAPLYLPVPPDPNTTGWPELVEALELTGPHLQAFTSLDGMAMVVGKFVNQYQESDFATLARFWPDPAVPLALNPGLPINATLPLNALTGLANGDEALVLVDDVGTSLTEQAQTKIREACLAELGADVPAYGSEELGEWEIALSAAADQGDIEAFLGILLEADVVVPTTAAVPHPDLVTEPGFPWRTVPVGGLAVVPLFSSTAALGAKQPRVQMPFLAALAGWPGEDHLLCFNPGGPTELFLSGQAIAELVSTIAAASETTAR